MTSIPQPDTVLPADAPEISDTVDVLVVGCGIAGACAAVEAATAGARVLVLERAGAPGGTTAMAGGHFYLGGGTAVQQATGQEDTAEAMADYLRLMCPEPDEDKIRAMSGDSVEHFDWLEALGFQFERSFFPGKAVIQPGTEGLMFTGNEKVWPYREQATPAPRGHKVPVPGDTGGASMVTDLLVKKLGELGVEIRCETGARQLVVDADGRVAGVVWRSLDGREGTVRADSVILAAGGFVMNKEMVAEFTPGLSKKAYPLGTPYDDGLAIGLGMSAGGDTAFMTEAFVTAPVYPPSILLTGIIVNAEGKRFVAEDSYHSRTSRSVLDQPDATAYLIVDSEHIEHPEIPLAPFIDGWETVEEMAEGLDLPVDALRETLENYNRHAANGEDPEFHKHPDWLAAQDTGPWGAYDLRFGHAIYAGFTLGGLTCDVDGRVTRTDGSPVEGLYAAGACASNIAQDARGYSSGTQLAEGSYFGRRAGRHAAAARTSSSST